MTEMCKYMSCKDMAKDRLLNNVYVANDNEQVTCHECHRGHHINCISTPFLPNHASDKNVQDLELRISKMPLFSKNEFHRLFTV